MRLEASKWRYLCLLNSYDAIFLLISFQGLFFCFHSRALLIFFTLLDIAVFRELIFGGINIREIC